MATPSIMVCDVDGNGRPQSGDQTYYRPRFRANGRNAPTPLINAPYNGYRNNIASFRVGEAHIDPKTKEHVSAPMNFKRRTG